MTDKELDDLFNKSFAQHRMPVPDDMWNRVNPQKEKKRRILFWWWTGLGAAAFFLIAGTATWLYHSSAGNEPAIVNSASASQKAGNKEALSNTKTEQQKQSHSITAENSSAKLPASSASPANTKPSDQTAEPKKNFFIVDKRKEKENKSSALVLNHKTGRTNKNVKHVELMVRADKKRIEKKTIKKNNIANNDMATLPERITTEVLPTKDSSQVATDNTIAADNISKKVAKDDSSVSAAHARKTDKQKATNIELMIAGYGNDRNVYDAAKNNMPTFVTLGAINPNVKTKLYSASINMRIEKPIAKNLSFKTGLQFLQTRQHITYDEESVNQFAIISSLDVSNDTMRFARIRSQRSVVKSVYNSISVPFLVSYHTNGSKVNVGASAGVLLNVISWYSGKVPDLAYQQTMAAKNVFRQNTAASLYLSLNAVKNWGNWQLFAEPNVQYNLSSITKSQASFKQKMTGYGIGIGIKKKI